jgi:hypothetical protein
MDIHQARSESIQEELKANGYLSREDGGQNTPHIVQVREDPQTSGGRHPVMCWLNDAGPPH